MTGIQIYYNGKPILFVVKYQSETDQQCYEHVMGNIILSKVTVK